MSDRNTRLAFAAFFVVGVTVGVIIQQTLIETDAVERLRLWARKRLTLTTYAGGRWESHQH